MQQLESWWADAVALTRLRRFSGEKRAPTSSRLQTRRLVEYLAKIAAGM
jgi:hypothetical protein